MTLAHRILALLFACALVGCAARKPAPAEVPSTQPTAMQITLTAHPLLPADPDDPRPTLVALVHLDVYQLDVPIGTVSRNQAFWKRVDDQCLGVGRVRVLGENGIHCGIAPKTDWGFFREQIEANPSRVHKSTINGVHGDGVELELNKNIGDEDLFVIDSGDALQGRSYESCVNMVTLSFQPAARRPGAVRVSLCPTVRSQRQRLEFSAGNQESTNPFGEVNHLYDVGLAMDVPDDSFMVVAPSEQLPISTSIGGRFFILNDKTEQLEQILIIVPSFLRLDGKPITLDDTILQR